MKIVVMESLSATKITFWGKNYVLRFVFRQNIFITNAPKSNYYLLDFRDKE